MAKQVIMYDGEEELPANAKELHVPFWQVFGGAAAGVCIMIATLLWDIPKPFHMPITLVTLITACACFTPAFVAMFGYEVEDEEIPAQA